MKIARPYRAVFRCTAGCPEEHSIWQPLYRCPRCGALLQVEHDLDALRDRSPAAWMRTFDERYKRTTWPYGSGVWGKKEWICPELRNDNVVSMDEGGTNMFWAERFGQELGIEDLWVKQCGNSHTGSFKDLGMTVLVSVVKQMVADGAGVRAVACASTGDTSAALAAYAAAAGIPAIVILPRGRVTPAQLVQPLANGARVLALDTDFDGCMTIVRRLAEEEGVYLANSMNSLQARGPEDAVGRDRAAVRLGSAGRHRHSRGQSRQRQRDRRRVRADAGARRHRQAAADRRRAGGRRQPALRRLSEQLGLRADDRAADHRVGDPDRQPGLHRQGDSHAAAVRRHRRAGDRERAGGRGRARRSHRDVQLPAHGRRAGGAGEAGGAGRHRENRSGDRHLDGQRAEIHASSRSRTTRPASRASRRGMRTLRWSCRTTTTPCAGRSTASCPPNRSRRGAVDVAPAPPRSRNLEIRRRLARGCRGHPASGRAHHGARRAARRGRVGAGRRHRPPAERRQRSPRPGRRTRPDASPRCSCGVTAKSPGPCCPRGRRAARCSRGSMRRRASTAISAAPSPCSGTWRRAPATCSRPAASGCRPPSWPPSSRPAGAGRSTWTARTSSRPTAITAAPRRIFPRRRAARGAGWRRSSRTASSRSFPDSSATHPTAASRPSAAAAPT